MKRWFALLALGVAGCGGSELQYERAAATSAQEQCPKSIAPGPRAAAQASKPCGQATVEHSWLAFVLLPNAPADASRHVVYITRTQKGWKAWYEWNPQNPEGAVVDV